MSKVKTFDIPCTGYSVKVDFYEGESTDKILLAFIGWTSSRSKYRKSGLVSGIAKQTGRSALVFEYSGHGESPFSIDETRPAQHFLEVICVFDWVRDNYPQAEITVLGTSYGGFMATQLTKYREFKNLILRVPAMYRPQDFYSRAPDVARTPETAAFRKDANALSKHPLLTRAKGFSGNVLLIVHERDEFVPKETTDAYKQAFGAEFLNFDTTHSPGNESAEWLTDYQKKISDWLNAQK